MFLLLLRLFVRLLLVLDQARVIFCLQARIPQLSCRVQPTVCIPHLHSAQFSPVLWCPLAICAVYMCLSFAAHLSIAQLHQQGCVIASALDWHLAVCHVACGLHTGGVCVACFSYQHAACRLLMVATSLLY